MNHPGAPEYLCLNNLITSDWFSLGQFTPDRHILRPLTDAIALPITTPPPFLFKLTVVPSIHIRRASKPFIYFLLRPGIKNSNPVDLTKNGLSTMLLPPKLFSCSTTQDLLDSWFPLFRFFSDHITKKFLTSVLIIWFLQLWPISEAHVPGCWT